MSCHVKLQIVRSCTVDFHLNVPSWGLAGQWLSYGMFFCSQAFQAYTRVTPQAIGSSRFFPIHKSLHQQHAVWDNDSIVKSVTIKHTASHLPSL
jgi:hypothetical protein